MKLVVMLLALVIFLAACTDSTSTPLAPKPNVDTSSPDMAVKSYWQMSRWVERTYRRPRLEDRSAVVLFDERARREIEDGLVRAAAGLDEEEERIIDEVEFESETRAVVWARERLGAMPDFRRVKYVVTSTDSGWRIEDVLRVCWSCEGKGEEDDFEQAIADLRANKFGTNPKKPCEFCGGRGWESSVFADDPETSDGE